MGEKCKSATPTKKKVLEGNLLKRNYREDHLFEKGC
jgi:hypothetical protein